MREYLIGTSLLLAAFCNARALAEDNLHQQAQVLESATKTGLNDDRGAQSSVEVCWSNWKASEQLKEGKNDRDGHMILLSHKQRAVNVDDPGARNWLSARDNAFQQAALTARAALADTMRIEISSSRSSAQRLLGGDQAPPSLEPIVNNLSIADKANVLVDKALDNEISKYDPKWNRNASPDQKRQAIAIGQARYQSNVAAHSELFAAGAFTVVQCEGPSTQDEGKYSVLVGLIWSPKLATIAESLWNTNLRLPPEPAGKPLEAQFDDLSKGNPNWLAYTMGARVFTDEHGERVVVGFGAVPQTAFMDADQSRASLEALTAIQQFFGEKIEADREQSKSYEQRELDSGENQFFDTGAFDAAVKARSKRMKLPGAAEIVSWRGRHPWANAKMQVVAMAWSARWAKDSTDAAKMMDASEKSMSEQGAVPEAQPRSRRKSMGEGTAIPAYSGASSSTHGF